ncbi:sugar phosphate isomerase/epimerase family protein [uncultured Paludibaculum sp.]|uniref:sugar phosphate isomerase/epimerase family protein n=1 Tax=uncultured Paludibaculum sp. TaxID=1765020 RepID=UPI002AAAA3AB|nr:sugar phosphate isomerase/epimerase family protein [uncultured Paludibaculum sp.]
MEHALSTQLIVNHRLNTVWLDRIWNAGVPKVEIFCARQHFDYHDQSQVNELGYWFRDAQLKCHSLHSPMYNDDCWGRSGPSSVVTLTDTSKPRRLQSVEEIKRAIAVAEKFPFQYLIQHLGVSGEEYSDEKLDAAFTALEDLQLFAKHRGVEILIENIPNRLSSAERLLYFSGITHLDLKFCLDTGHAHIMEGIEPTFALLQDRLRSTHVHDNNGKDDKHLFPLLAEGGSIPWKQTMDLLRTRESQYPLVLEVKDSPAFPNPLEAARQAFDRLENL